MAAQGEKSQCWQGGTIPAGYQARSPFLYYNVLVVLSMSNAAAAAAGADRRWVASD